ncbi:MAG TPA: aldo/keto reductase [Methanomassiliicoccales archaeon]
MKYKKLGMTGLLVSEMTLGTMTFGGGGVWSAIGELKQEQANEIIKASLDSGINMIDTANVYSNGESERMVGRALKSLEVPRESVVIATKVAGGMGSGPNDAGLGRKHIMSQVKASLERLQTDYIDLYQIHAPDPTTPIEETMGALNDLVRSGLVRYVGCSNLRAWEVMKANHQANVHGWARFESVQSYYSIAGRDIEREIVPMLEDQRLGLLIWSPLAGGLLSGKFRKGEMAPEGLRRTVFDFPPVDMERAYPIIDLMQEIANARQVSVARVALAWLLSRDFVTSVIIGVKTVGQLRDNLEAASLHLSDDEFNRLDDVSRLRPEYPGWMAPREGGSFSDRRRFMK